MFRQWLKTHRLENFDLSGEIIARASDRAVWDRVPAADAVNEALSFIGYDWPTVKATDYMAFHAKGDRLAQEKPSFARRRALTALVCAEVAEHRGRFIPDIANGLFALCEETFWGISAHMPKEKDVPDEREPFIDIFAAQTAEIVSLTAYFLHDELHAFSSEITERVGRELERRILTPYLAHWDYWWSGFDGRLVGNWNPWILSSVLTVALTSGCARPRLDRVIEKILDEVTYYYDCVPADGGSDEGITYWFAGAGKLFELCEQLYLASGGAINFFTDKKIIDMGKYGRRAYIGKGRFANFADGNPDIVSCANDYVFLRYGERIGDAALSSMAKELKRFGEMDNGRVYQLFRELNYMLYADKISALPDFAGEETCVLPAVENAFVREGKWYYAAKGGNNAENHNHNDVGSFTAWYDARPVVIDPGIGVYNAKTFSERRYEIWAVRSPWHALPTVNGCEQINGKEYRADAFSLSGKTTKISFAHAYGAGSRLVKLERTVDISEDGVFFSDEFAFDGADNTVSEHFVTPLPVLVKDGCALLGGEFEIYSKTPCRVTVEDVDLEGDSKLTHAWETDVLHRVTFTFGAQAHARLEGGIRLASK